MDLLDLYYFVSTFLVSISTTSRSKSFGSMPFVVDSKRAIHNLFCCSALSGGTFFCMVQMVLVYNWCLLFFI